MTYHKRPLQQRACAHCEALFESNHQSRMYCSQSCNTQAWRARQPAKRSTPAKQTEEPTVTGRADLAFSAQNVGMLALGTALGTAAVQGTAALWQQAAQGGSDLDLLRAEVRQLRQELRAARTGAPPADGVAWLPKALRSATAPLVPLQLGAELVQAVRVEFGGQVLYHHAGRQLLLWADASGRLKAVRSPEQLAQLGQRQVPPAERPAPAPLVPAPQPGLSAAAVDAIGAQWLAELPVQLARDEAEQKAQEELFMAALQASLTDQPND